MDRHIEVIGVDHGWSGMKTVSQVFTTGVKEITTEPAFYNNVVEFNGSYYKVGGKRLEVRDLKVENDNFYILTLAAVAKELNRRGMRNANILLSVGLPLTRFGAEKQDFIDYLSKEKEVTFRFDNEQYRIRLARVSVFPQCYAAVADRMKTLPKRVVVVDIGSWTIDIMPIEDSAPNEAECITIREGLIKCMRTINEECMRQYGKELSEEDIQEIMRTGKHDKLPQKYLTIVEECLRAYVDKVYNILLEHGYNLEVTEIVFVGGGANVVKRFGNYDGNNIQYIEDSEHMLGAEHDAVAQRYAHFWRYMMNDDPVYVGLTYSNNDIDEFMNHASIEYGFFTVKMGNREATQYYTKSENTSAIQSKARYDSKYEHITSTGYQLMNYAPGSVFKLDGKEYVLSEKHTLDITYGEDLWCLEYPSNYRYGEKID